MILKPFNYQNLNNLQLSGPMVNKLNQIYEFRGRLSDLQQELKPLSRREISALVPQYSDVTIKRALINLQKTRQIKLIGLGRASKYILQNP